MNRILFVILLVVLGALATIDSARAESVVQYRCDAWTSGPPLFLMVVNGTQASVVLDGMQAKMGTYKEVGFSRHFETTEGITIILDAKGEAHAYQINPNDTSPYKDHPAHIGVSWKNCRSTK